MAGERRFDRTEPRQVTDFVLGVGALPAVDAREAAVAANAEQRDEARRRQAPRARDLRDRRLEGLRRRRETPAAARRSSGAAMRPLRRQPRRREKPLGLRTRAPRNPDPFSGCATAVAGNRARSPRWTRTEPRRTAGQLGVAVRRRAAPSRMQGVARTTVRAVIACAARQARATGAPIRSIARVSAIEADAVRPAGGRTSAATSSLSPPGERSEDAGPRLRAALRRNARSRLPCSRSASTNRGKSARTDSRSTSPAWMPASSGSARYFAPRGRTAAS